MSKFLDSLTGYFFSGSTASQGNGHLGRVPGDTPADGNTAAARANDSADRSIDSRDDSRDDDAEVPLRLRDRLLLRKAVQRQTPNYSRSMTARRPWGDATSASPRIHPLASIDPRADLAPDVEVGPFCVIGPDVSIGPGCRLMNNVTIVGHTVIGSDNVFFPNAVIGADPQDLKYRGEDARLIIGDSNHFRENVTVHIGTATGSGETRIGSGNLLMVNCHVGHDAIIGDGCVLANNVMLAGHVHIGNRVSMMGGAGVHHFVSIGDFAFVAGYAQVTHDVPPYVKVDEENHVRAVNVIGLRRGLAITDEDIAALEVAVRHLFISKKQPMSTKIAAMLADENLNSKVREVVDSIRRRALGRHGRYLEGQRKA